MSKKKLTIKQQKFADEYIITGNATESAINAGYSKKTARFIGAENLTKPNIKIYIDERLEELQSQKVADQQEVMEYLTSVLRGEIQDEVVLVVGDGDFGSSIEKEEKRSDTNDRTKAAELLGKRYRMWTDRMEVEMEGSVKFIDDIGDADED